jgi:hypothetical protein
LVDVVVSVAVAIGEPAVKLGVELMVPEGEAVAEGRMRVGTWVALGPAVGVRGLLGSWTLLRPLGAESQNGMDKAALAIAPMQQKRAMKSKMFLYFFLRNIVPAISKIRFFLDTQQ